MAGVLQFTLGLETADFLNEAGISSAAITALAGAGEALHKVLENVFKAFEQGAALEHLSKRTGESAGKLYQLEEAFKACGGSAESLPTMLYQMQKALGGVSEMGESTADVFHKLGLDVNELKKAGPAEALGKIMERMGGLSQDSAAKASSMIFGRMGGGQAVQMSRSSQEFREAFADAARQADIFDRAGAAFAKIKRTIQGIKREFVGFWAGLAEGAAPAVQMILDWLKKIDLTSMGQKIGAVLGEITEAFGSGEITALIVEGFQAAFEQVGNYAMRMFNGVCAAFLTRLGQVASEMPELFGVLAPAITATLTTSLKLFAANLLSTLGDLAATLGAKGTAMGLFGSASKLAGSGRDDADKAEKTAKGGINNLIKTAVADTGEMADAFKSAWVETGSPLGNDATANLQAHLANLGSRLGSATSGGKRGGGESDVDFGKGLTHRAEGNVFEKMGFNMGGAGGPIQDVVKNTARTADAIDQLREVILYNQSHYGEVESGLHLPS
jgi:hypothetical protein